MAALSTLAGPAIDIPPQPLRIAPSGELVTREFSQWLINAQSAFGIGSSPADGWNGLESTMALGYNKSMFKRAKLTGKGVIPEHLKDRFRYLDGLTPAISFGPWHKLAAVAVGGLQHIGFAAKSDLLLVVSSSGRGVVDCETGDKIARDDEEYYPDFGSLDAQGIGPLEGQQIRVAGTSGGGLSHATEDGWLIELHPLSWPKEELFLCPPGQTMLWNPPATEPQLSKLKPLHSSLVAYGFSPTGKSLVIATSSDLEIYSRD